jgi:HK97 family phage portal protein
MAIKDFFRRKSIQTGLLSLLPPRRTTNQPGNNQLADAYEKWVYFCVNKNADAVASVNYRLLATTSTSQNRVMLPTKSIDKKDFSHDKSFTSTIMAKQAEKIEEIVVHPFLTLLEKPNKDDTQYTFKYKMVTNLEMFGIAYIYIQLDKRLKIPVHMEVLHSQFVTPKIDKQTNNITEYKYGSGTNSKIFPPDEIITVTYYSPYSDIMGFSPLQACYNSYALDKSFDEYQLALNANGGNPGVIIKYAGQITDKQRDILESQWNKTIKGIGNTGKVKVIGNDFNFEKLGMAPKDMDYPQGRKLLQEAQFATFGVPMSFSNSKEVNRASAEADIYKYQKYTILPKIKQIVDDFNSKLIPFYNEPRIYLSYENPVEQINYESILSLVSAGVITAEEARSQILG